MSENHLIEVRAKVAVIENEIKHLTEADQRMTDELSAFRKDVNELTEAIVANNELLSKWRGIVAGVAMAVTFLWAAAAGVMKYAGVIKVE